MADVHGRILKSAENMYAGALAAFEGERFWWAEITAGAAMGAAMFLATDTETPANVGDRARLIISQAKDIAERARTAWVRKEAEGRLQGSSSHSGITRQMDDIVEYIHSLVSKAVAS